MFQENYQVRDPELQAKYDGYARNQQQFVQDVERTGAEWEHYSGRWYYQGPAVRTGDEREFYGRDDVARATEASLGSESMGFGLVVWAV